MNESNRVLFRPESEAWCEPMTSNSDLIGLLQQSSRVQDWKSLFFFEALECRYKKENVETNDEPCRQPGEYGGNVPVHKLAH